ncbi:transmembrane protein 18-domain-containing protein [Umbelopsis sp. PMI_123]|nr:transmembrane protein 18-domain-containing protein [Umbelopsis sp. PMI_123]
MQSQHDIVKAILGSLKNPGSGEHDALPSFEQAIFQAENFIRAIDWSQPWLLGLVTFHVTSFLVLIMSRNKHNLLSGLLFFYLFLACLSQPLNQFLSNNWDQFASANYFDDSGLFLATVYSLPLIINSILALVLVLRATCTMLVSVKRKQLERQAKAKKKSAKQE